MADNQDRARLLHGIHERLWHACLDKLGPMLRAGGLPKENLAEIPEGLASCKIVQQLLAAEAPLQVK